MRDFPHLGHGVGLRPPHYPRIVDGTARADWFEVISENFMIRGGRPLRILERARAAAPVVLHGVSMNLGGTDPLDPGHLDELAALARRFDPAWISEHLCWGAFGRHYAHDLLPLPYTEEALAVVVDRVRHVQERLGRRILVENVSSYVTYQHSTLPEWTFLGAVAVSADCGILLDVNNVYVSATNHGFSPDEYLAGLPHEQRKQQKLLRRKVQALTVPRGAVPDQIQLQTTHSQSHLTAIRPPTEQGMNPLQEIGKGKWFEQVVLAGPP